jgi:capsule biosynthesis phosphatase
MIYTFVVDVDGTLCEIKSNEMEYAEAIPKQDVIDKVNALFNAGHTIVLFSARGMRTYEGDMHYINKNVRPVMEAWLHKHNVYYHDLILGKPWGPNVRYVDDAALYINDFLENF